jgi:hypothetical protein
MSGIDYTCMDGFYLGKMMPSSGKQLERSYDAPETTDAQDAYRMASANGGIDQTTIPPVSAPPPPGPDWYRRTGPPAGGVEEDQGKTLLKYFLHGLAYSLIMTGVAFVWAFILVLAAICGGLLGIILALGLLVLAMGAVNSFLADAIWEIKTESGVINYFVHGLVLFIFLLVASIPSTVITSATGSLILAVVMFLVYCFIDGFIARYVANMFRGKNYRFGQL